MKHASILVVVAGAALVGGTSSVNYKRKAFTDKFDDGTPLTAVDGTASGHLSYKGFVYTELAFPRPPSGTQIITTGLRSQVLEGQVAIMRLNDKMKCSIKFTAHSATPGTELKTKSVTYKPARKLNAYFDTPHFPIVDFGCLHSVDVTLVSADLPAPGATVGIGLDNVLYAAYLPV